MGWRWTAYRLAVSAFLLVHLSSTVIWVLPPCPIKALCFGTAGYYMIPLGLWQYWGMFAPDPVRNTITLEAEVIDAQGIRHGFAFPKLADYPGWEGVPKYRHSKFAANLILDEFVKQREFAARHVVRQLKLPPESFPVDVRIIYQIRETPPPGSPPTDLLAPTRAMTIGAYVFSKPDEVRR
jgi:hypothetical protein